MWRSFFSAWSLRNFAFGMIAVFSPIYFYTKGYGLGFIFIFLAVQAFTNGFMRLPYAYFLSRRKKDVRIPFAVSMLALGFVYGAYALFIDNKHALLVIAAIDGILQCALWSSYHYVFSAAQHHKHIGSQVGVMYDGSYLSAIIAIALGGLIGQHFGLVYNFLVGAVVLAIAAFFILRAKISWPHRTRAIKQQHVDYRHIWRDIVAGSSNVIDASIVAVVWPLLFVVFSLLSYVQVGFVVAAGLAASLLLALVFGRIADDYDTARTLLDFGVVGTMLSYMLRVISIGSGAGMILLNIFAQVVRGSVDVSYSVLFYRRMKKADSKIRYIATYESVTGYVLAVYFMILWLVHYIGASDKLTLVIAFMIAASVAPLVRLIAPDNFKELG
jgi:MFS family permease